MSELPEGAHAPGPSAASERPDSLLTGVGPGAGGLPPWRWALRLAWLALQIILVLWFGQKGVQFVYQGF